MQRLRILLGLNDGTEREGGMRQNDEMPDNGPPQRWRARGSGDASENSQSNPLRKDVKWRKSNERGGGDLWKGDGLFLLLRGVVLASTIVYTHECVEGDAHAFIKATDRNHRHRAHSGCLLKAPHVVLELPLILN